MDGSNRLVQGDKGLASLYEAALVSPAIFECLVMGQYDIASQALEAGRAEVEALR